MPFDTLDFREFTKQDWDSWAGAERGEGLPIVADGTWWWQPQQHFTVVVDPNGIEVTFWRADDSEQDVVWTLPAFPGHDKWVRLLPGQLVPATLESLGFKQV